MAADQGQPSQPPGAQEPEAAQGFAVTEELPGKAADAVDSAIGLLHDKAIRPLLLAARGIVFGILAGVLAVVVLVLVAVGLIRLLDVYAFPGRVWASYCLVGFVFTVAGLAVWSQRSTSKSEASH